MSVIVQRFDKKCLLLKISYRVEYGMILVPQWIGIYSKERKVKSIWIDLSLFIGILCLVAQSEREGIKTALLANVSEQLILLGVEDLKYTG